MSGASEPFAAGDEPLTDDELRELGLEVTPNGLREVATRSTPAAEPAAARQLLDGATFALAELEDVAAVWGAGEHVAWSAGEPLWIVGPPGVGKTTLAQRLILARIGLGDEVLGLPVAPADRPVLYVAADRPTQARRSLRRMVDEGDRAELAERLIVWRGPAPHDAGARPENFAKWIEGTGAGTVVLDSAKDIAADLTRDEVGNRVNRAAGLLVQAGLEVLVLHHQRKASGDNKAPNKLADVYGSTWLTAGAGSVLLLWGEPGDPVLELRHLKQPALDVGPLSVLVDHAAGALELEHGTDLVAALRSRSQGFTAADAAKVLYGSAKRADVERARRKLEGLRERELAYRRDPERGEDGRQGPATYFATTREPMQGELE